MLVNPIIGPRNIAFTYNEYLYLSSGKRRKKIKKRRLVVQGEDSFVDDRVSEFSVASLGRRELIFDLVEGSIGLK